MLLKPRLTDLKRGRPPKPSLYRFTAWKTRVAIFWVSLMPSYAFRPLACRCLAITACKSYSVRRYFLSRDLNKFVLSLPFGIEQAFFQSLSCRSCCNWPKALPRVALWSWRANSSFLSIVRDSESFTQMGSSRINVGPGMEAHFTSTTIVVARISPSVKTEGFLRD